MNFCPSHLGHVSYSETTIHFISFVADGFPALVALRATDDIWISEGLLQNYFTLLATRNVYPALHFITYICLLVYQDTVGGGGLFPRR